MPYVKPISGHGTTVRLMRYLTKEDRALAADYLNLEYDSRLQIGADMPTSYNWAAEMDSTRAAFGTDSPWKGKQARTFKHYVFSPDLKDGIGLATLRELAVAWATENYPGFQVAIVYHDDNESRIPHAHIVVNNVNLDSGRRLQDAIPRERLVSAQELAKERGLSHFEPNTIRKDGFQKRAESASRRGTPQQSRQRVYVGKAEAGLREAGKYSWVSDMRDRVSIARSIATSEADFKAVLETMGVIVSDNSPKCARRDWVYSFADHPARRVSGEKMGLMFGRDSVRSHFLSIDFVEIGDYEFELISEIADRAIELSDLSELHDLALTLEANERYRIDSMEDYAHVIGELERSGSKDIEAVKAARSFSARKGLLPQRGSAARVYSLGSSRNSATWSGQQERDAGHQQAPERDEPSRDVKGR